MPRAVLKLALGLVLALLCPGPGLAQPADDLDAITAGASEDEALITALDEFGQGLDSPELEGMDRGKCGAISNDGDGKSLRLNRIRRAAARPGGELDWA